MRTGARARRGKPMIHDRLMTEAAAAMARMERGSNIRFRSGSITGPRAGSRPSRPSILRPRRSSLRRSTAKRARDDTPTFRPLVSLTTRRSRPTTPATQSV
jgi:hypothetical protein